MFSRKQRNAVPYAELIPAFYCRVSSDEQAEQTNVSIPDQVQTTHNFAQQYGMPIYDSFTLLEDEKGSTLDRPQLHVLRQWIKEKRITAIVVRSTDRLSRSPGNGEILFDEMMKYNVRFFVTMHHREFNLHDINDRDMLLQEMIFNRRWLRMLTDTMRWGKHARIERGNPAMGGIKYGFYKWRDDQKQWHYEHSEDAITVQSIFHWFTVDRLSVRSIQQKLHGTPTPKESRVQAEKLQNIKKRNSGEWSQSTIYNILRDPAYRGELTFYRNSNDYDPITIAIPQIIHEDVWNAAQHILDNGKRQSVRNTKHEFLMARLIFCQCGATLHTEHMQKRNKDGYYHWYRCGRNDTYKNYAQKNCTAVVRTWDADLIDTALWAWLMEICEHPELLQAYLEESKQRADEFNAPIIDRLQQIDSTRKRWEQKLMNLLNLYSDRDLNDPRHKTEKLLLERARDEAAQVFSDIDTEEDQLRQKLMHESIDTSFIDAWVKHARSIRNAMATYTFNEKRKAIESLNITGSPITEQNGRYLLVYFYGQYVETIMLAADSIARPKIRESWILIARIPLSVAPH